MKEYEFRVVLLGSLIAFLLIPIFLLQSVSGMASREAIDNGLVLGGAFGVIPVGIFIVAIKDEIVALLVGFFCFILGTVLALFEVSVLMSIIAVAGVVVAVVTFFAVRETQWRARMRRHFNENPRLKGYDDF